MAGFNKLVKQRPKTVLNKEMAKAYKPSRKLELVLRAATTLGKADKFYESALASDRAYRELIRDVTRHDPEFVMKTAYYVRNVMGLRTPATVMIAECARTMSVDGIDTSAVFDTPVSDYVAASIKRVDDMTELVAYCLKASAKEKTYTGRTPIVIQRGLKKAFGKFDEYQFAKYDKEDALVTPKDVMCIAHPVPGSREQKVLYKKIGNETLDVPETWEQYIMIYGSTKKNWSYILDKMGYLGILRNVRNLVTHGVDTDDVVGRIADEERVRKSRIFPFQFYSAYRALDELKVTSSHNYRDEIGRVQAALTLALTSSAEIAIPEFTGRTAIFCDNSGSMNQKIHPKSNITFREIANLYGILLAKRSDEPFLYLYGTNVLGIKGRGDGFTPDILRTMSEMDHVARDGNVGGNTHTYKCFDVLTRDEIAVDRAVFFTDEQGYGKDTVMAALQKYRAGLSVNPYVFSFDIAHYGTTQFPESDRRTAVIGGWTDSTLNFIHLFETEGDRIVRVIENLTIAQ